MRIYFVGEELLEFLLEEFFNEGPSFEEEGIEVIDGFALGGVFGNGIEDNEEGIEFVEEKNHINDTCQLLESSEKAFTKVQ